MRNFLALICFGIFTLYSGQAQILDKIKKVKDDITANTIDKLSSDPITTSFRDVDKTKHFENAYGDNADYKSIFEQPFDPEKGFTLAPGFYEGTFQSFCIKAGTYMPTQGRGRFYAPIKGPKADIISHIVETYQESPDLTQREVQLLLWAIIAKTDFAKMKGPVKATALKMLSPKQIARLSKGALDNLTRKELKKVANESEAIRAVLEAEDNLRRKYYSGARTYQEYEQIAMRAGVEPIVPGWEAGRWTQHPDGYFLRYYPTGYQRTKAQIFVPENMSRTQFNPSLDIAVPPSSGQRLLQTSLPSGNPGSNTGGYPSSNQEDVIICEEVINNKADYAIKQQMIMQNIPGLAVAVFKEGKIVHLKGYGYANTFKREPINITTVMKWASISKSVTGVAAAQLQERGLQNFNVRDKITDYVRNWGDVDFIDTTGTKSGIDRRPRLITIAQLLNNSSGIQHYGTGSDGLPYTEITLPPNDEAVVKLIENTSLYGNNDTRPGRKFKAKEAVDVFNQSVLSAQPRTKFIYSSYGFVLAGAAIDKVSPNGYSAWVRQNIIDRAGLRSMGICEEGRPGHTMSKDGMLLAFNKGTPERTLPAGGYESNICDLAKYALALSKGDFFDKESSKDILWNNSDYFYPDNQNAYYSYGLRTKGINSTDNIELRVHHGGHGGNSRSYMQFFPKDNSGIVIMASAVYVDLPQIAVYVYRATNIRPSLYGPSKFPILRHTPRDKCGTDMESDNDQFNAVWRKTGNDVLIRTGRPGGDFGQELMRLREEGYHCKDIETFVHSGLQYWDAVFQKGFARTRVWTDLKKQEFVEKCAEMRDQGYRLYDLETYINVNGKRRWAGVFRKIDDPYSVRLDRSLSDFAKVRDQENANGKKLIDIEVYFKDGKKYWSGVFTKGEPNKLNRNYSIDDFRALNLRRRGAGYRLIDAEYYRANGDEEFKVAAIWEKSNVEEKWRWQDDFCEIMKKHDDWSANGFELIDWNRLPDSKPDEEE